ncbi:MAG: MFS transporter, partial [Pseudomonadota bacterium]
FGLWLALPSENLAIMMGLMGLAGVANGAYQAIPWAMYPDLMDVTRAQSGEAIEGGFSAVWLFGQKVANALAPALLSGVIAARGWRETTQGTTEQTPEALLALQVAMTLVPMGLLLLAILGFLFLYRPLAGQVLARV